MKTCINKIETIATSLKDLSAILEDGLNTGAIGSKKKAESLHHLSCRLWSVAENLGNFSAVLDQELQEAQKALIDAKQEMVESFEHPEAINKPHRDASKIQSDILALLGE